MTERKKVTYKHLKKGQEIKGVEYENCSSSFIAYVKDINPAFVTVEKWNPGGTEEKINAEAMFLIEMMEEEIREKYNKKAGDIVRNIQNSMLYDEIGCHEMDNSWLYGDPWELAQKCAGKKLSILGHCRDITPKTAIFSGDVLDVGVCAEDEDGDRFWCHFRSEHIRMLVRSYERYQEQKAKGEGSTGSVPQRKRCRRYRK